MNITDNFLKTINELYNAPVPPQVLSKAKRAMQDYLCVTLAGAYTQRDKLSAYYEFAYELFTVIAIILGKKSFDR